MANKTTRPVTQDEFEKVIATTMRGFQTPTGVQVKPSRKMATIYTVEANLGLRISDILGLKLSDIIQESGRYHLDMVEQKTGKRRTFTVPAEIYAYIQSYAIEMGIKPTQKLFPITTRAVQKHLKMVAEQLGLTGIGTHSFRKFFCTSIYNDNGFDIELCRTLMQHSSVAITQRYLGVQQKQVEDALNKHIKLPNTDNEGGFNYDKCM